MYCGNCGGLVNNGEAFCGACGTKTLAAQQSPAANAVIESKPAGFNAYSPGMVVEFGRYPQYGHSQSDTPIRWIVVDVNPDTKEALMLSESVLDCTRYHGKNTSVTWANSDIRSWLYHVFYNRAFNNDEKSRILITMCAGNGPDSGHDLPPAQDYVFLLNTEEARKMGADPNRQAISTDYAKEKKPDGCSLKHGGGGKAKWWLRNRGGGGNTCAAFVNDGGNVYAHGHDVHEKGFGVRPAIRIITAGTINEHTAAVAAAASTTSVSQQQPAGALPPAIRPDKSGGKILLTYNHHGHEIIVKNRFLAFELIINGNVVAATSSMLDFYWVETYIGTDHFKATAGSFGASYLYLNGQEVVKGKWS